MEKFMVVFLCFTVGLAVGRKVTLPAGPLIRVEGQAVSLRCEVSEYEGPKEQDFEWKVTQGSETIQVISTFDPTFSDQSIRNRVHTEDISVERLGDSTVELRIKDSRVTDSAIFTCSTPSTDSVISGNYSADVLLRVIPNTLVIVPEIPAPVVYEGRFIHLRCNISYDVMEGIFLSVTWTVKNGLLQQDLLTFGPDLGVNVGSNFIQRYVDGVMRLQLDIYGSYNLVLSGTVPADQGMYICTARQWTREQGSWNRIQEKTAIIGEVAVIPTAESLNVQVLDNILLNTGDTLNLTCLVSADDLSVLDLELTWLLNATQVLIHLSKDGVETKASNAFSMNQVGRGNFKLEIHRVEQSDVGLYSCRVKAWIQSCWGKWYNAAEKTSAPIQVIINSTDPAITVSLHTLVTAEYLGDPTEFVCQVSNISHLWGKQLGVSWFHAAASSGNEQADVIASLNENGALIPSEKYRSRIDAGHIVVSIMKQGIFKLRLLYTTNIDAGEYVCSVSTWILTHHDNWKKSSEYQANKVSLTLKTPAIIVVAHHIRQASSIGSTFGMNCRVSFKNSRVDVALSVVILVQYDVGAATRKLASLSPDLVLKLENWRKPSQEDSVSLVKSGKTEFQFRIQGVQVTDHGFYFCEVSAWTRQNENWVEMVKGESNKVHIMFEHTKPSFELAIGLDATSVYPWETVKVECIISVSGTSPSRDNVAYDVKWFQGQLRGSDSFILLASIDRWGVVVKRPRNDTSDCSLERLRGQRFALNIYGTQDSDAGEYFCIVTPWVRSSTAEVWSKEPEIISKRVFLNVRFALWNSMKLPLLYGTCASLSIGLFSLILGLVCAHCCIRNTTHPLHRHKLINLQND